MDNYQLIVFFQGEDAIRHLEKLQNEGESAVIADLREYESNGDTQRDPFWGDSDDVYTQDQYHL